MSLAADLGERARGGVGFFNGLAVPSPLTQGKNFRFHIKSVYPQNAPLRGLRIDVESTNPFEYAITGLSDWLEVRPRDMQEIARGSLLAFQLAFDPGVEVYRPGETISAALYLELPPHVLGAIEVARSGRDLELEIRGRMLYSVAHKPALGDGTRLRMGERRVAPISGDVRHVISRSDWLRFLSNMQWSEVELLEIPRSAAGKAALSRAYSRLLDASTAFREGRWTDVGVNCRKAFESAMKDASGNENMAHGAQLNTGSGNNRQPRWVRRPPSRTPSALTPRSVGPSASGRPKAWSTIRSPPKPCSRLPSGMRVYRHSSATTPSWPPSSHPYAPHFFPTSRSLSPRTTIGS